MRKKTRVILIVAVLSWIGLLASACPQGPADTLAAEQNRFPAEGLREDFQQLREAMEENGSIIYQFTEKETFDRLFDEQYEKITRAMTVEEFRRIIAPVVAQAGCLHTSLWMPHGYWHNATEKLIPLRLVFLKGKCFVWRACAEAEEVRAGSEITAINGKPISEILDVLKGNISSDGYNDSFRTFKMNEGFAYRYALDFGFKGSFELTYRLPGQEDVRTATVQATDREGALKCSLGKNSTEGNALDFTHTFEVIEDSTVAIITARSFAFYDTPETFTSFIDSAFNVIHEHDIEHLILDIRNNDGGNPFCTAHLLSYLEPKPLPYFAEEYGRYASLAQPIPRAEKPFTGALYTLINGNNISTTPHFCALLKHHTIGTFIGTETGGTYACNAATKDLTLKNTRFILSVATKSFAAAVEGFSKTRGIIPDTTVTSTIEDLLNGKDVQKECALELIRSQGCTVVMAARDSLVLVGNNEDRNHPQTIVIFKPATEKYHGSIIFGYDDTPIQGGMNDQGLFIDANALAPTGWKSDPNKPPFGGSVMLFVLTTCATCENVKAFFEKYNVPALEKAQFPVADRSGASMVVEYGQGRVQFLRSNAWYQIATNFVMSNIKDEGYPCARYRTADTMLSEAPELSPDLIRKILDKTHQEGNALTVYSNIYDLKKGTIRIYNLRNFEEVVIMDLAEELKKGERRVELPGLFKKAE